MTYKRTVDYVQTAGVRQAFDREMRRKIPHRKQVTSHKLQKGREGETKISSAKTPKYVSGSRGLSDITGGEGTRLRAESPSRAMAKMDGKRNIPKVCRLALFCSVKLGLSYLGLKKGGLGN